MNKTYILVVYSYDKEYRKQIGEPSSSMWKLEKVQDGVERNIDHNKFYSVIEER